MRDTTEFKSEKERMIESLYNDPMMFQKMRINRCFQNTYGSSNYNNLALERSIDHEYKGNMIKEFFINIPTDTKTRF